MIVTTTAIAFISSSIGLGLCGFLFLRAFRKMGGLKAGNKSSFLLLGLIFSTAIQHGVMGFGNLFFAQSSTALQGVLVIADVFLTIAVAFGVYLIFYLFLPLISPWPATIIAFLFGVVVTVATTITQFSPFINVGGSIDWNFPHLLEILIFLLVFINISTLLCTSAAIFFQSKSRDVRFISLVLVMITVLGLLNIFLRFILLPDTIGPARTRFFDLTLTVIGVILIGGLLIAPLGRKRITSTDQKTINKN